MGSRMDEDVAAPAAVDASGEPGSPESLAAAARERRPGAFDALVRHLADRLTGYAIGIVRDRRLAEEAVQEAFIRMYRFLPAYEENNVVAWSFTITHRACSNLLRRERRHARLRQVALPSAVPDPAHAVDRRIALQAAMDQLPEHHRQAFLLHAQGLSYVEIAGVLGVPIGTVRSRLFRARDALRAHLRTDSERTEG
ncbi:MAG TPA: RNA polymerase sigma factor [Actinomycetota bacterium]